MILSVFFFFQAEDGIRDSSVTGVQTCALPILASAQPMQAPTPALTIASAANNPLILSWPGVPGWSYQVEYKTNLADATWTAWGGPLAGSAATLSLTNPPDGATQRFFRVRALPL